MTNDDADYYRGRATAERQLAKEAANIYARRAHQELADNYEILCRLLTPTPRRRAKIRPMIDDGVGFNTVIQILAAPSSAELMTGHSPSSLHRHRPFFEDLDRQLRIAVFLTDEATVELR